MTCFAWYHFFRLYNNGPVKSALKALGIWAGRKVRAHPSRWT